MYFTLESAKVFVCQLGCHLDQEPTAIKDGVTFKAERNKLNRERNNCKNYLPPELWSGKHYKSNKSFFVRNAF